MGLASDRTVYSSKRNRPLLLYGRLLDDSRPSHGLTATNPDYFLFADNPLGTRKQLSGVWHNSLWQKTTVFSRDQ